jgi:hypothetical protein
MKLKHTPESIDAKILPLLPFVPAPINVANNKQKANIAVRIKKANGMFKLTVENLKGATAPTNAFGAGS